MFYLFCICFDMPIQFRFIALFYIKHVRLLGFSFCLSFCFYFQARIQGLYACAHLLHAYAYNWAVYACPMYAHAYSCLETQIHVCCFHFLCFIHAICLSFSCCCFFFFFSFLYSSTSLFCFALFVYLFNANQSFDLFDYHEHVYHMNTH